jgi:hypothetical protein
MNDLVEFLAGLFSKGCITFRSPPEPVNPGAAAVSAEVLGQLEGAYAAYGLDVAGKAIALDVGLAVAAAELLRQASWALVCHRDRVEDLERRLTMPRAPRTASHHASADLVLRYLPQVHRRARALDPSDVLVGLLDGVLRQWPLSGVLAGLHEAPTSPLDFGGHDGLMLLFAERLAQARDATPAWRPAGRPFEYVELVAGGTARDR